jgi:hypothetical protein
MLVEKKAYLLPEIAFQLTNSRLEPIQSICPHHA